MINILPNSNELLSVSFQICLLMRHHSEQYFTLTHNSSPNRLRRRRNCLNSFEFITLNLSVCCQLMFCFLGEKERERKMANIEQSGCTSRLSHADDKRNLNNIIYCINLNVILNLSMNVWHETSHFSNLHATFALWICRIGVILSAIWWRKLQSCGLYLVVLQFVIINRTSLHSKLTELRRQCSWHGCLFVLYFFIQLHSSISWAYDIR